VELPFEIIAGLLFATLAAAAVNLQRTIEMFFVVALCGVCLLNCGESLGIIFNTVYRSSTGFALNIANTTLTIGVLLSGKQKLQFCARVFNVWFFFGSGIMSVDTPRFFKDINYISPIPYGVAIMMVQSFRGQSFTCTDAQRLPDGTCPISTGQQALDLYKFNVRFWPQFGGLVATTIVYRFLAYVAVKLARLQLDVTKSQKVKEPEK
jgi:hypothetical protein